MRKRTAGPAPRSLPCGGRRFPLGGIPCRRRGRRAGFLQAPGFPANHEESSGGRKSGAWVNPPHLPRRFQPEIAPEGMGDNTWLPCPVLLLAGLLPALLPGTASFTPSLDSDFTFTLPAGQKECFYQPMPPKASLEIEYQVSADGEPASFLYPSYPGSPPLTRLETSWGPPGGWRGDGRRGSRRLRAGARGSARLGPGTDKLGGTWNGLPALSPLLRSERGQRWRSRCFFPFVPQFAHRLADQHMSQYWEFRNTGLVNTFSFIIGGDDDTCFVTPITLAQFRCYKSSRSLLRLRISEL